MFPKTTKSDREQLRLWRRCRTTPTSCWLATTAAWWCCGIAKGKGRSKHTSAHRSCRASAGTHPAPSSSQLTTTAASWRGTPPWAEELPSRSQPPFTAPSRANPSQKLCGRRTKGRIEKFPQQFDLIFAVISAMICWYLAVECPELAIPTVTLWLPCKESTTNMLCLISPLMLSTLLLSCLTRTLWLVIII